MDRSRGLERRLEIRPKLVPVPELTPAHTNGFSELGLSESAVNVLMGLRLFRPTSFQEQAIPSMLLKRDLLAEVDADAGWETTFAVSVIERILRDGPVFNPTALVLVPTREIAIEVHEAFFQLSARATIARCLGVFEGKPITSQIGPLKHGVDIVVGTPGRVNEHVKRGTLRVEQLKMLVLCRVDEMLDSGLSREIAAIVGSTPKTRQTMLFSPTMSPSVLALAHSCLSDPELVGIERDEFESTATSDDPEAQFVNLYIGLGSVAGISARDLVGVITNEAGLSGEQVGSIRIKANFSLVAVPAGAATDVVRKLQSSRIKGRKAKIRLERFKSKNQGRSSGN